MAQVHGPASHARQVGPELVEDRRVDTLLDRTLLEWITELVEVFAPEALAHSLAQGCHFLPTQPSDLAPDVQNLLLKSYHPECVPQIGFKNRVRISQRFLAVLDLYPMIGLASVQRTRPSHGRYVYDVLKFLDVNLIGDRLKGQPVELKDAGVMMLVKNIENLWIVQWNCVEVIMRQSSKPQAILEDRKLS